MKSPMLLTEMTLGPSSPVIVMALPARVAVVVADATEGRARMSRKATKPAGSRRAMATILRPFQSPERGTRAERPFRSAVELRGGLAQRLISEETRAASR